jgi:hypothetical protein
MSRYEAVGTLGKLGSYFLDTSTHFANNSGVPKQYVLDKGSLQ